MEITTRIRSILENIPDKTENMSTTSKLMKEHMVNFIQNNFKDQPTCIEFGTHRGQTTLVLAQICSEVYTINKTEDSFNEARQLHTQWNANNIHYIPFNLYSKDLLEINKKFDVAFIDAGHSYEEVQHDVRRVITQLNWNSDTMYIIFDDYGLHQGVFNYVEKLLNTNWGFMTMELQEFIGQSDGYDFGHGRQLGKFGQSEGVVIKIKKKING